MNSSFFEGGQYVSTQARASDALHAKEVINLIYRVSSQHAALIVALNYNRGFTKAEGLYIDKLSKVMHLPKARVTELVADMRSIIVRTGGL